MIFRNYNNLTKELKIKTLNFLKKYELICSQLCYNLKKNPENCYTIFTDENFSAIYGIIFIKNSILHSLPFAKNQKNKKFNQDFVNSLTVFFKINFSEKIKNNLPLSLNGEKSGSELILKVLKKFNKIPKQTNEYKLMRLNPPDFCKIQKPKLPEKFEISRQKSQISEEKFNNLLKLQSDYEKEEVLPNFIEFNIENTKSKLKINLKNQIILTLQNQNQEFISKAQTNAIGFKTFQLGGIFTPKEFRKNNYSFTLLYFFIKKILKIKKIPVLFVKNSNEKAKNLYKKLCFIEISEYFICYF